MEQTRLNDAELIAQAKRFLEGKDFFVDQMYSKRTLDTYRVICFTVGDRPDFIKADNLVNMLARAEQA